MAEDTPDAARDALRAALAAYEESHATHQTVHVTGTARVQHEDGTQSIENRSEEVDERAACGCDLCTAARAALGVQ